MTTDTTSQCYESFIVLYDFLIGANLSFYLFATSASQKGEVATDIGYAIHVADIMQSLSLVFFNMYANCYIQTLIVNIGKVVNSPALAGNIGVTLGYELYSYYQKSGALYAVNEAMDTVPLDFMNVGTKMGIVVSQILVFTIPVFKFDEFG